MKKSLFPVRRKGACAVHLIPYSEHSSYDELRAYVRFLKPHQVSTHDLKEGSNTRKAEFPRLNNAILLLFAGVHGLGGLVPQPISPNWRLAEDSDQGPTLPVSYYIRITIYITQSHLPSTCIAGHSDGGCWWRGRRGGEETDGSAEALQKPR